MLGDFHLLDSLSERGTVTGTIFTGDSDLLSALNLSFDGMSISCWIDEWIDRWMVVLFYHFTSSFKEEVLAFSPVQVCFGTRTENLIYLTQTGHNTVNRRRIFGWNKLGVPGVLINIPKIQFTLLNRLSYVVLLSLYCKLSLESNDPNTICYAA